MKRFLLFCVVIPALIGCGSSAVVDFDQARDFSAYSTYEFYPSLKSGLHPLDEQRMMRALDSVLSVKGIERSIVPELLVNFYVEDYMTESNSSLGISIGGGSGNVGYGVSGGVPLGGGDIRQLVTLDVIDADEDVLIWQGVIGTRLREQSSPDRKEIRFQEVAVQLLEQFPPSTKGNKKNKSGNESVKPKG